ncbi:hypothetical protein Tco_1518080 [Tanacetum coccineum]
MRTDELYKFCDRALTSIRTVLHDITSNLRMDYLPKRRWSNLDRQRSRIMIKAIDKLLLEIRLMGSLEKFIGGRDYGEDLRLLERTIWLCHILSYSISGGAFLKSKTIEVSRPKADGKLIRAHGRLEMDIRQKDEK